MKRILFILMALGIVASAKADERSAQILRKLTTTVSGYTSYAVDFTVTMEGEFSDVPCELIVSGKKYHLDVYDSEIFFDGSTRYTYSELNDEVILEKPDPDSDDIFAHPDRLFTFYDQDFSHIYKGTSVLNGKNVSVVELTPKSRASEFQSITLYVENTTSLPVRVSYDLTDQRQKMDLRVTKFTPNISVPASRFVFDPSQYPDIEIIDFR